MKKRTRLIVAALVLFLGISASATAKEKTEKEQAKKESTERVEGSSIEELIENIKKKLYPEKSGNSTGDEETTETMALNKTIISEEDN